MPIHGEPAHDMIRMKVKSNKIRLINNGVNLSEIESVKKNGSGCILPSGNAKKICYIGQMASQKNVLDMIKTFDLLYKCNNDVGLYLIDDGPERSNLEDFAKSLASASAIRFLGYRDDRLNFLTEIDLFTMTSSLEGIPRCMMEAMAMGVPVAAYDIPGVDKLIIHEKTGLMAKFGDIYGLKECWRRILEDSEFSKTLGRNSRNHILENFSAKRMAEDYTELCRELFCD